MEAPEKSKPNAKDVKWPETITFSLDSKNQEMQKEKAQLLSKMGGPSAPPCASQSFAGGCRGCF